MREDKIPRVARHVLLPATFASVVALLAAILVMAASASAATTIGQTSASTNYACLAEIDTQSAVASGTSFVVPGGRWLLSSWSTYGGSTTGGLMSMMIFQPTAAPNVYTVVAESPVESLSVGVLNTFSASVVVQSGDLLGFWSGAGAACATFTGQFGDLNPFQFGAEPPVGATMPMSLAPGFLLNISASLSSPADLLADLLTAVTGKGPGTSLADKVTLVQSYLAGNDTTAGCTTLSDFISEVQAQTNKALSAARRRVVRGASEHHQGTRRLLTFTARRD
jgi:hypothetical protein